MSPVLNFILVLLLVIFEGSSINPVVFETYSGPKEEPAEAFTNQHTQKSGDKPDQSLFDFLNSKEEVVIHLSEELKTIKKNFDKEVETEGQVEIIADSEKLNFAASFDLGGKTRRIICKMPPVKINLKKKELESSNFVKKCDRIKIVFQCNNSKSMAESIRKEKFLYDLHNLVSEYGHRAILSKVRLGENEKLVDGVILESDDDIEYRTKTTILKNRTIVTSVVHRDEYVKMCLFQFMIANADWSARKGHNTDLFKLNADNTLIVVPYDFDYAGIINNAYAVPPENLPISAVTQRYFMDKSISPEELQTGIDYFLNIESDVLSLCDDSVYLSSGSRKGIKKFIEGFYKIVKNEKKAKRLINN